MASDEAPHPAREDPGEPLVGLDRARRVLAVGGRFPKRTRILFGQSRRKASSILKPERPETVLETAPFFQPFPHEPVENEFLNLLWRSEALLALSAILGQVAEDQVTHWTRELFHDRLSHQELSLKLFGHDYAALHRWMDTVPGSQVVGG